MKVLDVFVYMDCPPMKLNKFYSVKRYAIFFPKRETRNRTFQRKSNKPNQSNSLIKPTKREERI